VNPSAARRRARAPRSVAVAALVLSAAVVAPTRAALVTGCGGTVEDAGNGWLMSRPAFPAGPAEVTLVASPAFDPNLLYASNGVAVVRSRDAGCVWKPVFTASPSLVGATAAITALAVPSSANSSAYLYVGVTSTLAGISKPAIAVSDRYGDRWLPGTSGLPDLGSVLEIAASPQVQMVAFAVVDNALPVVGGGAALYSTSNGGETWTARTGTGESFAPRGLLVDPVRQAALYGLRSGRPVRSLDNAATFPPTAGDPGALTALGAAPGGGSVRLAGTRSDGSGVARSDDAGATWRTLRTPAAPVSVAMAPLQDAVVVSDATDVTLYAGGRALPRTPDNGGAPAQLAVSAPTPAGFAVTGVASGGVFRTNLTLGGATIPPPLVNGRLRPVLLLPVRPLGQFPSLLLPQRLDVTLAAGQSARVPYRLLVPRTPTPVDVMFLIDSTGSYQAVIDGLRQAIARLVNALNGAGLNVRFGIGNFEDYPPPYGSATPSNVPYNLGRRIGPADAELVAAIQGIVAHDGTSDGGQDAYTAVYQAVTGAGEKIGGKQVIDAGLGAGFRPDATKLVMVSTDTEPHQRGQKVTGYDGTKTYIHPGPTYEQVVAALVSQGVRSIGIPVYYSSGASAVGPLRALAGDSHALAPLGGVDCDGNGSVDLATGEPLVCVLGDGSATSGDASSGLTAAIVGLVAGISDPKPVSLRVTRGADRARILSAPVRTVDLHADNELDFDVLVSCPRAAAHRYDIALESATPTRLLAGGALSLTCGGLAAAARIEPPLGDAPLPPRAAAANAVANANVNVNTNANTNPNPNPQPNAQPGVNANVGIATSEEQQIQLALVEGWDARTAGESLAMSDHRAMQPGAGLGLATAAMLAGATGVAVRRRRRTQPAVARAHR
jgi:hypothetical protein